jgi:hypothetical protein
MGYSELRNKLEGIACELCTHAYSLSHAERAVRLHEMGLLAGQVLAAAEGFPNAATITASIDALLHRVQSHVGMLEQRDLIRQLHPFEVKPQTAKNAH